MSGNERRKLIGSLLFISLAILPFLPIAAKAQTTPFPQKTGPFIDEIRYEVITQDDQQFLALQDNQIDVIGNVIDPTFLDTLLECRGITVDNVLRNGYGYLMFNTAKYPFNITAFRRAFAFALDKEAISDDVWDGLSVPQDSLIPQCNPYSIEGLLPYNYYEANVTLGNLLLDDAGFHDVDNDGYREAPDGSDFDVLVENAQSSNIAIEVGAIAAETLQALGIDAVSYPTDFWYPYWCRCCSWDFDMVFMGSSFNNFDVDWMAYEFWSEYAWEPWWNLARWGNSSFDSWRDQLVYSTSYDDVYEAAYEMQRIWVYECPLVITYENLLLTAYRTDKFEGFVNDAIDGVPSWWTNYKVHLKDDPDGLFGGTLRWSNPLSVDSFNFMTASSTYDMNVLQMLYDSLLRLDSNGFDIPWLATDYVIETHEDNYAVQDGNTRITFNLLQNITWTDGVPLTAEDVAYSLNYYRDTEGNPYGADLENLFSAIALNPYTIRAEFDSESYWHLHTISDKPIIPKHVFQEIGLDGWINWSLLESSQEIPTSGPFRLSEHIPGEYTILEHNPGYFRGPNRSIQTMTQTSTLSENFLEVLSTISLQNGLITGLSVVVIIIVLAKWKLEMSS
ncbi:MAG: ABC transporter substrate-binding protein [Candidatus Thorarchaeota archaeon]